MSLSDIKRIKLPELKRIAVRLRVPVKVDKKDRSKEQLQADIKKKVIESGNLLYKDWFARIKSARTPWKLVFDPLRKYNLTELEELSKRYGISVLHKTIPQLKEELQEFQRNQNQLEEKYRDVSEREEIEPEHKYNGTYTYSVARRKAHISLNNLPYNPVEVANIVNSVLTSKREETGIDTELYDKFITTHGTHER